MAIRTLVLGLVLGAIVAAPGFAQVKWRSGDGPTPRGLQPAELVQELERLSQREARHHAVVHLDGPSSHAQREALAAAGVRLLSFLGGDAYFASLSPTIDTARVLDENTVVHVEAIQDDWKLHPDLAIGLVRPWSIVPPEPGAPPADAPTVALYVLFHRDVDVARVAPSLVARHGGKFQTHLKSVHGAVIHLAADRIEGLAGEDAVRALRVR